MTSKSKNLTLMAALVAALGAALVLGRGGDRDLAGKAVGDDPAGAGIAGFRALASKDWVYSGANGDALLTQVVSENDPRLLSVRLSAGSVKVQQSGYNRTEAETVEVMGLSGDDLAALGVPGEIGSVLQSAPGFDTRIPVSFSRSYTNPVVFATVSTYRGGHPLAVRVDNVTSNGAELVIDEPAALDGGHTAEQYDFLVVEAGVHTLADGQVLEVGKVNRSANRLRGYGVDPTVTLQSPTYGQPLVITTLQKVNRTGFMNVRVRKLGSGDVFRGFQTRVQHENDEVFEDADILSNGPNTSYTLGYLALGRPWSGVAGRLAFEGADGLIGGRALRTLPRGGCIDVPEDAWRMRVAGIEGARTQVATYREPGCADGDFGAEHTLDIGTTETLFNNVSGGSVRVTWMQAAQSVTVDAPAAQRTWAEGDIIVANAGAFLTVKDGDLKLFRTSEADQTVWEAWSTNYGDVAGFVLDDNGRAYVVDQDGSRLRRGWSTVNDFATNAQALVITDDCLPGVLRNGQTDTYFFADAGCLVDAPKAAAPAMPIVKIAAADLDGDGHNEMLLIITAPDGTGTIVPDPLGIADLLRLHGMPLPENFWSLLSPTQRALLVTQMPAVYGDTIETAEVNAVLDATDDDTPRTWGFIPFKGHTQEGDTAFSASDSTGPLEASITAGEVRYMVEFDQYGPAYDLYASYGHAEVTVGGVATLTYTGPTAYAVMNVDGDGFTMGGGVNLVGAAYTVGDTSGSYAGISADVGASFWADYAWGRDGQYGYSLSIPVVPVGVAFYVHEDDATLAYDFSREWLLLGAHTVEDLSVQAWNLSSNWAMNHGGATLVTVENGANDVRVTLERFVDDSMRVTVGTASNSYSAVVSNVDQATRDLERLFDGIGGQIDGSYQAVEDAFVDVAQSSSRFVTNAAGEVVSGAKSLWKKVKGLF